MSTKQIHSNHRYRMRKRFLDNKASGFYPHELIEMLLYYPIPRRDTNPTAHELLDKFGGIEKLLSADVSELRSCNRIGDTTACFIAAASEICRRAVEYRSDSCEGDPDSLLVEYIKNNFLGANEDICFLISVTAMLEINNSQVIPLREFKNKKIAYSMIAHAIIDNNFDRVVLGAYYPNVRFVETNKKRDLMVISSEIKKSIGTDIVDTIVCSNDSIFSLNTMCEIAKFDTDMKKLKDQYIKRILQSGADSLSDKELLEFILTFTENVPDRAEGLLKRCGSLRRIIDRDALRIADEKKINENTAVMFGLLAAICRCSEEISVKNMCLSTAEQAKKFFSSRFIGFSEEHFIIVAVNSNFRSTDFLHFSSDSYDEVNISVRRIFKFASETGKRIFFLAHNHPDSSSEPSDQDILLTKDLANAFGKLDLVIADHIIVGNDITSMREYPDLDIFEDIKGYKFEERDNYYK